jgi:hypothetical protein
VDSLIKRDGIENDAVIGACFKILLRHLIAGIEERKSFSHAGIRIPAEQITCSVRPEE